MRFPSTAVASEPTNPGGYGAWGATVCVDGERVYEGSGYLGKKAGMTNNVAEYSGVQAALQWAADNGFAGVDCDVVVRGDSKMAVKQLAGEWKVKAGAYVPYFYYAQRTAMLFKSIRFVWIPREKNAECDALSKKVLTDRGVTLRIQPQEKESRTFPSYTDSEIP